MTLTWNGEKGIRKIISRRLQQVVRRWMQGRPPRGRACMEFTSPAVRWISLQGYPRSRHSKGKKVRWLQLVFRRPRQVGVRHTQEISVESTRLLQFALMMMRRQQHHSRWLQGWPVETLKYQQHNWIWYSIYCRTDFREPCGVPWLRNKANQ